MAAIIIFRSVFSGGKLVIFLCFLEFTKDLMQGWAKLSLSNHQIKTDHNPRPQLSAVIVLQSAVAKALQLVTNLKVLRMGESFPPFASTAGLTFAFADIYSNFESLNTFLWNNGLLLNHFMNDEKNEVHFFPVGE